MYKTIFYTVLITCFGCGALWFTLGRNNTTELFGTVDRADRDLERVEQSFSEFGNKFDGYATSMAGLSTESSKVGIEIRGIRKDFQSEIKSLGSEYGDIQSGFQYFTDGINRVEEFARRSVINDKRFADVLYWYRRRGEQDENED